MVQVERHTEEPALGREDTELGEGRERTAAKRVRVAIPTILKAQGVEQVDDSFPVNERIRMAPPLTFPKKREKDDRATDHRDQRA